MGDSAMIAAIIQARMGSSRLPGKVMLDIAGRPMLFHVIDRVQQCRSIDKLMVATTDLKEDDPIALFCEKAGIACFRGSERDVLDRYYQAALHVGADAVVRITSDCPLIDPAVVDKVVHTYLDRPQDDYVSNTLHYTYPDGQDTEVFSMKALAYAWENATSPLDREHVTTYIRANAGKSCKLFNMFNVTFTGRPMPRGLRWTVDEQADIDFVRAVFERLYPGNSSFDLNDILGLLAAEPQLTKINLNIARNEGLYLSLLDEPPLQAKELVLDNSRALKAKARKFIPSCTQTFSKGPTQFVQPLCPVFLDRGKKAHVWDVDGNEFIDCILGLGPVILGYHYPAVEREVTAQLVKGVSFSLPHPLEVEVAEILTEIIPCAEMVRFGKNGSDATSGAVRVARAYTGREVIACCGYHGWQDWYIGTTSRNAGVPRSTRELTVPFAYNDIASLQTIFDRYPGQVAAVIMEPVSIEEPRDDFLAKVKDLAHRNGALVIFDEVITGFRLSLGGAQEYYGVAPDLACFGKAMANGFPLAAVVGTKEIMEVFDEIFFSFTFGGEAVSLAAARATLREFMTRDVIGVLWEHGQKLQEGVNVLAQQIGLGKVVKCKGLPPRTVVQFEERTDAGPLLLKSLLQQEMVQRGILWAGYHNVCFSLTETDILDILRAYRAALPVLKQALDSGVPENFLKGDPVGEVFRKI